MSEEDSVDTDKSHSTPTGSLLSATHAGMQHTYMMTTCESDGEQNPFRAPKLAPKKYSPTANCKSSPNLLLNSTHLIVRLRPGPCS